MTNPVEFDIEGFYAALDATRGVRHLTWRKVAAEAGVSASTLTRMAQGKRPDVDSLARLTNWSGLKADDYMHGTQQTDAEPLAQITTYLRSDPSLTKESAVALSEIIKVAYARLRQDG